MPTASELIANALGSRRQREEMESPFYQAGRSLIAAKPVYNTGNAWQDALLTGLQGAAGGVMAGYGQSGVDTDMQGYSQGLASALGSNDPTGTLLANPDYAELGGALGGVRYQNEEVLNDSIARALAQSSISTGAMTGQPVQGFKIGREGGALTVIPIGAEQPIAAPVESDIGTTQDPEMAAYMQGVEQARRMGVPRTQQGVLGQKRAEFVRGQMKTAQDEALKARQEADKLLSDAQQLSTLSDVVGDSFTGAGGQLKYKGLSMINSTDPVFNNAKEITGLGMQGIRNIRSDAQISENERRALLQALPSGNQPKQFNQDIAAKWAQAATIKNAYANWLEDAAAQGLPASQARRVWAEARKGVDMFSTDPKTGALAVTDPAEWQAQMQERLYGGVPSPVQMPRGIGDGITQIAPTAAPQQPSTIPPPRPGETKDQWKARIRGL